MEVEVMSQHYMGPLWIEQAQNNHMLFYVYINNGFLGRIFSFNRRECRNWYSPDITDKELILQINEWIEYLY